MSFIKNYWFGIILGLMMFVFMLILILILIAPKQDAKNRGFVFCTQNLMDNLADCDRALWCSSKAVLRNTLCDFKIISTGLSLWAKGKQPRPWSNYIFEPEPVQNPFVDEEARAEYLKQYPNVKLEMENLHKLRKELENEQSLQTDTEKLWQTEE